MGKNKEFKVAYTTLAPSGLIFTGSSEAGLKIYNGFSRQHVRACFLKIGGKILLGGRILSDRAFGKGFFVEPTLVTGFPKDHRIFQEELFLPFLVEAPTDSLGEAVSECNKVNYGLTAEIFSQDERELQYFFDEIETGVLYANRHSGATTGAWPGVKSFCGWKKSGSTGKGGYGPYYVQQFMREQSHTEMK